MKIRNLSRQIAAICFNGMLTMSISGCMNAMPYDAKTSGKTFAANLTQQQAAVKHHRPFDYRQPGYVNKNAYISENVYAVENLAYYGNCDSNRTYSIYVDHKSLLKTVENSADSPYEIDQQGANKPTTPHDFGGSLASGHPLWISDHHFFIPDRAARQIQLWNRKGQMLSVLDTPTSIHHIFQPPASTMESWEKNVFYAVVEGNQGAQISPAVIRFKVVKNKLHQTAQVNLHDYDPDNLDINTMGSHHADFHPDGVYIYMGSAEGHVFVINKNTMEIETMVNTGAGAGHTTFLPMRDQAIITNHNSTFMTVIDTVNHQFVRNVEVANSASADYKSQAHTSDVGLDIKYFYSTASHDGMFFRINLDTWEVSKTHIGGNLLMDNFIWNGEGVNM